VGRNVNERGATIDAVVKAQVHQSLRGVRQTLVWKLDGLSEYDIRRPLTPTGTNLLGLVKHDAVWEARYFGEVFERPFPDPLPPWDDFEAVFTDLWVTEQETRADVLDFHRRACGHADATIGALDLDARGYVPWWQEEVSLFTVMVHVLSDITRHAGHADILRETLDGSVGVNAESPPLHGFDAAYWESRRAEIERAARAADPEPPRA
jgi:hypothetical protein